jgi:predicted transcriptional regulator
MTDKQTKAFLIRLRTDARALLDAASESQRRSRASIIEALIRQHLAHYERTDARLDRMLGQ